MRFVRMLALVVVPALIPLVAAAKDRHPAGVPLKPAVLGRAKRLKLPYSLCPVGREASIKDRHMEILTGDPKCGQPARYQVSRDVLEGRIGREKVLFIDYDADGRFLTPFRDMILGMRQGELQPVAPFLVLGGATYDVKYDSKQRRVIAKASLASRDRSNFPKFSAVAQGLRHLNDVRAALGIPPVALSVEGSRDAMLHLRYCAENEYGHREIEDRPGYTEAGKQAGIDSLGYKGPDSVTKVIDGHLESLLHRMDLLDPQKTEIGIAADGDMVWIDTQCGKRRPWSERTPFVFPDGEWHGGTYSLDTPDPRPEGVSGATGIPVTVAFYVSGIYDVRVALTDPRGPVPCYVNDPDHHELVTNRPEITAVMMPKKPLPSGSYRVTVTWKDQGASRQLVTKFRIR